MKTAREFLLDRHRASVPKLDRVRAEVLASQDRLRSQSSEGRRTAGFFRQLARELIWRPRWAWAGFAAAWTLLLAVNSAQSNAALAAADHSHPPPADLFMGWNQEKVMAELIGQTEPSESNRPKPAAPGPRSDRRPTRMSA